MSDGTEERSMSEDGRDAGEVPDPSAPDVERPRASVPSTEMPTTETPSTDPSALRDRYWDVDPAFRAAFWKLVLLYKVGIIGLTLGLLLVWFDTYSSAGTALAVGGFVTVGYAVLLTRQTRARIDSGEYDLERDSDDAENPENVNEPSEEL